MSEAFNLAKLETLRFQEIVEMLPIAAWTSDPDGAIYYVNTAYTNLTGFTLEDLQKDNLQSLENPKEVLESWKKYSLDPLNETYIWEQKAVIRRKNGSNLRCLIRGKKVRGDG